MKSLKDFIVESYSNGVLDKSVKAPERKKVYNAIYNKLDSTKVTGHLYRDESWEGVKLVRKDVNDALEELNSKLNDGCRYEASIAADNGGYRKSNDGMSQWKQYKVEIYKVKKELSADEEYPEPFIIGTLNCHAAGTVKDPFDAYDMSFCISY